MLPTLAIWPSSLGATVADPRVLIAPALAAAGLACFAAAWLCKPAHGAEQPRAGFRMIVCEPQKQCEQRGKTLSSATACALDAASLENVVPPGTKVGCIKVVRYD